MDIKKLREEMHREVDEIMDGLEVSVQRSAKLTPDRVFRAFSGMSQRACSVLGQKPGQVAGTFWPPETKNNGSAR